LRAHIVAAVPPSRNEESRVAGPFKDLKKPGKRLSYLHREDYFEKVVYNGGWNIKFWANTLLARVNYVEQ
jgi:hypothetical protein